MAETPTKRAESKAKPAPLRSKRQRLAVMGAGIVTAALLLVAWFPLASVTAQRQSIASLSSQLAALRAEDRALAAEQARLSTPGEVTRVARAVYGMVRPGQLAAQVLPPNGIPRSTNGGPAPYAGDPGNQPVVTPSASVLLLSGAAAATRNNPEAPRAAAPVSKAPPAKPSSSLWSRVVSTLEFWR